MLLLSGRFASAPAAAPLTTMLWLTDEGLVLEVEKTRAELSSLREVAEARVMGVLAVTLTSALLEALMAVMGLVLPALRFATAPFKVTGAPARALAAIALRLPGLTG